MHYFKYKYNLEDYFNTAYPPNKRQENRQIYSAAIVKGGNGKFINRKKNQKLFTRDPDKYVSNIPTLLINPALTNKKSTRVSVERIMRPTSCIQRIGCDCSNIKCDKMVHSLSRSETSRNDFRSSLLSPKNVTERVQLITALPEKDDEDEGMKIMKTEPVQQFKQQFNSAEANNYTELDSRVFEKKLHTNKLVFKDLRNSSRGHTANSYSRQFFDDNKNKMRTHTFSSVDDESKVNLSKERTDKIIADRTSKVPISRSDGFARKSGNLNEDHINSLNEKLKSLCNKAEYTAKQNKRLGSALNKQKRKLYKDSSNLKKVISTKEPYKFWKENTEFLDGKSKMEGEKTVNNSEEEQKRLQREKIVVQVRKHRNQFLKRGNSKENLKAMTDPDKRMKKMDLIEARYLFVYKSDLDTKLKEGIYDAAVNKKKQKEEEEEEEDSQKKNTEMDESLIHLEEKKQKALKIKEMERQIRKEEEDAKKFKVYKSIMKHAMKNSFLFSTADREKYFGSTKLFRGGAGSVDINPLEKIKGSWSKVMESSSKSFQKQQKKLDSVYVTPKIKRAMTTQEENPE